MFVRTFEPRLAASEESISAVAQPPITGTTSIRTYEERLAAATSSTAGTTFELPSTGTTFIRTYEERLSALDATISDIEEPSITGTTFIPTYEERLATLDAAISDIEDQSIRRTTNGRGTLNTHRNVPRMSCGIKRKNKYYPNDAYSFLALNGPTIEAGSCCWPLRKILFFLFGSMSFVFQIAMFGALVCHLQRDMGKGRPGDNRRGPGVAITMCRVVALMAYMVFPNSAQMDMLNAIKLYPWCAADAGSGVPIGCIRISCILRAIQANIAICIFFFLIMCCDKLVDIILDHTAVNFISELDEVAFSLARSGLFGQDLAVEARRIAHTRLPACSYRASTHVWYGAVMLGYTIMLFVLAAAMMVSKESNEYWVKRAFLDPQMSGVVVLLVIIAHSCIRAWWNRNQSTPVTSALADEKDEDNPSDSNHHA